MNPAEPPSPTAEAIRILRFAVKRRRRGKIATLPEATREQINLMLENGPALRANHRPPW
jgi:hypothetical protein